MSVAADPADTAAALRTTLRRHQRIEDLCAASIRAHSGLRDLQFRGHRLHRAAAPLPYHAPHLRPSFERDDLDSFRGAADGLALRLRHSDIGLHQRLAPADPVARLIFESLEQYRVESLASLPGMVANLSHRHECWSLQFYASGLLETAKGMLLYTVLQVCRARVCAQPVVEATEDRIETTRAGLVPAIGHDLHALRRQRGDQQAYAPHALAIAALCAQMLAAADAESDGESAAAKAKRAAEATERDPFTLLLEPGDDGEAPVPTVATEGTSLGGDALRYRVFTRDYDVVVPASTLVREAQLVEFRQRLDGLVAEQSPNLNRLARRLRLLLARPAQDGVDGAQQDGLIDGRRLAQLVASPAERRLFTQPRVEPVADCAVTLLIDCSGSMKQYAEPIAVIVDTLARALQLAGVDAEVLGHTTRQWNGGRAMRDWVRAGRPAQPGRLNELCQLVFKPADSDWRRARRGIAALLKADLFREGIDGEALDWACDRIAARPAERRIVLVVSDGCPMDAATDRANEPLYLDRHLRDVVQRRSQTDRIEIMGVGVGLDLTPYFARSRIVRISDRLGNATFDEILELFAR